MLSPKTKRNISRIIPFVVIWFIFSVVYTLLEKGLLGNLTYYPSTGNSYDFGRNIFSRCERSLATDRARPPAAAVSGREHLLGSGCRELRCGRRPSRGSVGPSVRTGGGEFFVRRPCARPPSCRCVALASSDPSPWRQRYCLCPRHDFACP